MVCQDCLYENKEGARFCVNCGKNLQATDTAAPGETSGLELGAGMATGVRGAQRNPLAPRQYAEGKTPLVAALLSLIIAGVGQFYNGDTKKGLVMLAGALFLGAVTAGVGYVIIAVWSAVDAYQVAERKKPIWA